MADVDKGSQQKADHHQPLENVDDLKCDAYALVADILQANMLLYPLILQDK